MDIEYIYGLQEYLNSMRMFKHLHSHGIDLKPLHKTCTLGDIDYSYYHGDSAFNNFHAIACHLFEIVECYSGDYDDETLEDKHYWAKLANYEGSVSGSLTIIVFLDNHLMTPIYTGLVGESDYSGGSGELLKVGSYGVALFYDEDEGYLNWADVLHTLVAARQRSIQKEQINYEVAI